jgi:hypothetical protein
MIQKASRSAAIRPTASGLEDFRIVDRAPGNELERESNYVELAEEAEVIHHGARRCVSPATPRELA